MECDRLDGFGLDFQEESGFGLVDGDGGWEGRELDAVGVVDQEGIVFEGFDGGIF